MGWGTDLLGGIFKVLFDHDDSDESELKEGTVRRTSKTSGSNPSKNASFRYDPLEDDYKHVNQTRRTTQTSSSPYGSDNTEAPFGSQNSYKSSYSGSTTQDNRTRSKPRPTRYYQSKYNSDCDVYSKEDYIASKNQNKKPLYTYPTISKGKVKFVVNDKARLTFGTPNYKTYEHGVRGMSFPYSLNIYGYENVKILVSARFTDTNGDCIKSLVPELADKNGDLVIRDRFYVMSDGNLGESYIFVPFGVLDVKETAHIDLNLDVFIIETRSSIHVLRYIYGFKYYIYKKDAREPETRSTLASGQAGFEALVGIVAHVIKADGVVQPQEVRTVIDFFSKFNGVDMNQLKELLKQRLANPSNLANDCEVLRQNFNTQTRLTFLALFFKIAISDESVPAVERGLIEQISDMLGILRSDYISIKADFIPEGDSKWYIFGLTPKATKEQLKRAYREKCKKCHPDRFANSSPEAYKAAEEAFKAMQAAYDELMRGFM